MTSYEVHVMVASKGQPTDDATPVTDARREHLDDDLVARLCQRLRDTRGAVFASSSEEQILRMMRVIVDTDSGVAPTTAGLLALGRYPQQFFPQLDITFVAYPTDNGDPLPDGTRFLDNQSVDGPIPTMVATTVAIVRRNLRRRAVIGGAGREDRWDYPEEAVRELVANALMHRDLHPSAHGTQVRVALYPDRLEVASPGGLHGPISQQDLFAEPISSSRNAILAKLLEDVEIPGTGRTVCENRGSGLLATAAALRRAGIEPPRVHDSVREFRVTVKNEGLLDSQTIRWLTSIGAATLNDRQRLGLAFARRNGSVTNQQYRTVTGCDPSVATRELAGLAGLGLLAKRSDKRWTVWDLADGSQRPTAQAQLDFTPTTDRSTRGNRIEEIIGLLRSGPKSTIELSAALGMTREGVLQWLRRMEGRGLVRPTEANRKSSKNRWKLTDAPR